MKSLQTSLVGHWREWQCRFILALLSVYGRAGQELYALVCLSLRADMHPMCVNECDRCCRASRREMASLATQTSCI